MLLLLGTVLFAVALLVRDRHRSSGPRPSGAPRSSASSPTPRRSRPRGRRSRSGPGFVETVVPAAEPRRAPADAEGAVRPAREPPRRRRREAPQRAAVPRAEDGARGRSASCSGFAIGGRHVRRPLPRAAASSRARCCCPDMFLVRKMRERAERLSDHLPQAIDQIAISLEAGLGFDAAVSYFVRRSKSPLAGELRTMLTADPDGRVALDGAEEPLRPRPVRRHAQLRPDARAVRGRRHLARLDPPQPGRRPAPAPAGWRPRSAPRRRR